MVLRSNLHAAPYCSSPSGPGITWGLFLNPLHISAPSWTVGPVVGCIAAGSVPGLWVLNRAQPSLLMTATSHCRFFPMIMSLSYRTTCNERAMEMYTVFLHPSYTKYPISLFAVAPFLWNDWPFNSNGYSHCSGKC